MTAMNNQVFSFFFWVFLSWVRVHFSRCRTNKTAAGDWSVDNNDHCYHSNVRDLGSSGGNYDWHWQIRPIWDLCSNFPADILRYLDCVRAHLNQWSTRRASWILSRFRHYPTLASLQFQNSLVRLLIVIYFLSSSIYLTFCESCDMHWLLILIKIFSSTKEDLHIVSCPIFLPIIVTTETNLCRLLSRIRIQHRFSMV